MNRLAALVLLLGLLGTAAPAVAETSTFLDPADDASSSPGAPGLEVAVLTEVDGSDSDTAPADLASGWIARG